MSDEQDEDMTLLDSESSDVPEPFDNPIPEESYLGHVVAKETGLKVGRETDSVFAVVQPNEREKIEIGDYVRVPYYRPDLDDEDVDVTRQMLASVQSLSYNTQLEDRQFTSADSFGAEQYRYVAELSPIAEIELSDDENDTDDFSGNFVSRPPRPTVKIDKVSENEFLRCGLDIPSDGIYVGDIAVNGQRVPSSDDPLEYYLFNPNDDNEKQGEPVIFRHVLVAGSTGTGKTHTSKNILRQFAKCKNYMIDVPAEEKEAEGPNQRTRGLNMTIIDPEDEYTEMGEDPDEGDMEDVKEYAEDRMGLEYGAIGEETEFEIFAPTTKDSNTKELNTGSNEVTDFGIPFDIVRDHPQLMMPDDPQGPTRQLILKTIDDYFRERDEDSYSYSDFSDWFEREREHLEDGKYNENIVNAAARRITDRSEYWAVFGESSTNFTDEDVVKNMFSPNKVSVVTTGHLRGATQNLVVQAISSYVVESKISSNPASTQIKGTPMILALDEAHEYVQEPETTREQFIVNKFRRAARRGRKDKFGLYFITQNPADLDGEVRNQINTKIYMQLDRKVVNESDVYVPPEFSKQLPEYDKGQMVVVQPDVSPVEVVGLPVCLTKHSK